MPRHYVTFGQDHAHRVNGITLDCDTVACYIAKDAIDGRNKAFEYFGDKFFTDYHDEAFDKKDLKYFPKGVVVIDKLNLPNLTWKDAYKLPLKYDGIIYAFDAEDNTILDFEDNIPRDIAEAIVSNINGNKVVSGMPISNQGTEFNLNHKYAFSVRGWGHLIGIGGLNLGPEVATRIQNEFIDYINSVLK